MQDLQPVVESAFVATNATLIGEVHVSQYASVWHNATLRGELNAVRVGSYSSIGDNTTVYTAGALPTGVPASVTIGNHVTIQSNCTIYSCIIDDDVFVGSGSVIGEGCKIEKGAVIAPNSFIPPGRLITGRNLWAGNPVKLVRELDEEESYSNYVQTLDIWNLAQKHMSNFKESENKDGPDENSNLDKTDIDPNSLVGTYLAENYLIYKSKYNF